MPHVLLQCDLLQRCAVLPVVIDFHAGQAVPKPADSDFLSLKGRAVSTESRSAVRRMALRLGFQTPAEQQMANSKGGIQMCKAGLSCVKLKAIIDAVLTASASRPSADCLCCQQIGWSPNRFRSQRYYSPSSGPMQSRDVQHIRPLQGCDAHSRRP